MICRDFQSLKLLALGLGCMRLPKSGPADEDIDVAATPGLHRLRRLRVRLPAGIDIRGIMIDFAERLAG